MTKFCLCGNAIGPMSGSMKCRLCKATEKRTKQESNRENLLETMKAAGKVRLHSCLSSIHDAMPTSCACRKFVTFAEAKRLVEQVGRCVDFDSRTPIFFQREIVETSRHKNPPISTLGSRIAIERKTEHRDFDGKDITRLRASIDEDKMWRAREQDCKIDIEHQIAAEAQAKLIRSYTDAEWLAIEREFALHRGFYDGIGHDKRTLGSVGLNVRSQRAAEIGEEEIDESGEKPATDEIEPEAEREPTPIYDIETEVEFEVVADESEETEEEFEEAA